MRQALLRLASYESTSHGSRGAADDATSTSGKRKGEQMNATPPAQPPDERYHVAYLAGVDLLATQRAILESARGRATTLISATTLTTTLGGAIGLLGPGTVPLPGWVVGGVMALVVLVARCAIWVLLPHEFAFGLDAEALIDHYVEATPAATLDGMYRDGAIYMSRSSDDNTKRLSRLFVVLEVGVGALTLEVIVLLAGFFLRR